ncbi:hypothetical protein GOV14_06275 [Candidatus Pacearchaeota archaeon]|nr:hypothetical protein [Candidatus Pacearchaeota archaeon]
MVGTKKKSMKFKVHKGDFKKSVKMTEKGIGQEVHEVSKNIKKEFSGLKKLTRNRKKIFIRLLWAIGVFAIILILIYFWFRLVGSGW